MLPNRQTEQIRELSAEYLTVRNQKLRAQAFSAEVLAAKARGELIEKDLAGKQAQYLLINMRQKMLTAPDAWCRKILNLSDPYKAKSILKEMMVAMLHEIRNLPQAISDPNWLKTLEAEDGK
jgi:hypothetical protein